MVGKKSWPQRDSKRGSVVDSYFQPQYPRNRRPNRLIAAVQLLGIRLVVHRVPATAVAKCMLFFARNTVAAIIWCDDPIYDEMTEVASL